MISKGMKRSVMLNKFCSSALQVFLFECVNLSSHVTIKESGQIKGGYFYTSQFSSGDKNNHKITSKADFAFPKISPLLLAALYIITGKREDNLLLADVGRDLAHLGAFHSTKNSGNFSCYIKWNAPFRFGLTRILGTSLKVVHFDQSGYLDQSDWNDPFHLPKLLSPVPLYCILLTRTITKCAVPWVRSVQLKCTGHMKFPKFQTRIFVELPAHYN